MTKITNDGMQKRDIYFDINIYAEYMFLNIKIRLLILNSNYNILHYIL